MKKKFSDLFLNLTIFFFLISINGIANSKEFHDGLVAEGIISEGEILLSDFSDGVFSIVVKSVFFGQPEPQIYYCEITPNSYSCFRPLEY